MGIQRSGGIRRPALTEPKVGVGVGQGTRLANVLAIWQGQRGKPVKPTQFTDPLVYEIACQWERAAKPGLAALAVVLERTDLIGVTGQQAERADIFCEFVRQLARQRGRFGLTGEGVGFPFTPERMSRLLLGEHLLTHLSEQETAGYNGQLKLGPKQDRLKAQLCSLDCLDRGALALAEGKKRRAWQWFNLAVVIDPRSPFAYYRLFQLSYRPEQPAEKYLDAVLAREPNHILALGEKADLCFKGGRLARAEALLDRLIGLGNETARLLRAQVRRFRHDYIGAGEDLVAYLRRSPTESAAVGRLLEDLARLNGLL
jgi:tetratricopeptide (TPR) repeat protein